VYLKEHYVYAYYDEQGHPYYIGKGKGNRCFNKHGHYVEVPSRNKIKILYKNLSDIIACDIEENLIIKYGRKNNKTGILLNRRSRNDPLSLITKQKIANKIKLIRQKPKFKKLYSKLLKDRWTDPTYRKYMEELNIKKSSNPIYKKRISEEKKILWQKPEFRQKFKDAIARRRLRKTQSKLL